ncbi:MAG: hypothetical protein PHZ26_05980 [Candidatus Gracilibacteria bacterium]|nr:hypothetical protein [Candidatus Gracilibacteria bacterium]MDD2909262.1 hypothetical protein [Candidatus Gracilibacteria bacterium]
MSGHQENKKNIEISNKNSIDRNLQILKEKLSETKPGFDYKVIQNIKTKEIKYRLIFNGHELDLNLKDGKSLIETAEMVKNLLHEYKKKGFDKKNYKFYKDTSFMSKNEAILKVDNNSILPDFVIKDGESISKTMGSNMIIKNDRDFFSIQRKNNINTRKLAEFLTEISKDFFK